MEPTEQNAYLSRDDEKRSGYRKMNFSPNLIVWFFCEIKAIEKRKRSPSISRILFHLKDCWSFISIASHLTTHAIYPWSRRTGSSTTYLMLLRVEIARFTRIESTRLCCSNPHLTADRCYLLRCPMESGLSSEKTLRDQLTNFARQI